MFANLRKKVGDEYVQPLFGSADLRSTSPHPSEPLESASEVSSVADTAALSKEHVLALYQRVSAKHVKYRGRCGQLTHQLRQLQAELTQLQGEKRVASRQSSELREQCHLEQQAKAHLDELLRTELEERDETIKVLRLKLQLVGSDSDGNSDGEKHDGEYQSSSSNCVASTDPAVLTERLLRREKLLRECVSRFERSERRVADLLQDKHTLQQQLDLHLEQQESGKSELARLESIISELRVRMVPQHETSSSRHADEEQCRQLQQKVQQLESRLSDKANAIDQLNTQVASLNDLIKKNQLDYENKVLLLENTAENEKKSVVQELSRAKQESLVALQTELESRLAEEWGRRSQVREQQLMAEMHECREQLRLATEEQQLSAAAASQQLSVNSAQLQETADRLRADNARLQQQLQLQEQQHCHQLRQLNAQLHAQQTILPSPPTHEPASEEKPACDVVCQSTDVSDTQASQPAQPSPDDKEKQHQYTSLPPAETQQLLDERQRLHDEIESLRRRLRARQQVEAAAGEDQPRSAGTELLEQLVTARSQQDATVSDFSEISDFEVWSESGGGGDQCSSSSVDGHDTAGCSEQLVTAADTQMALVSVASEANDDDEASDRVLLSLSAADWPPAEPDNWHDRWGVLSVAEAARLLHALRTVQLHNHRLRCQLSSQQYERRNEQPSSTCARCLNISSLMNTLSSVRDQIKTMRTCLEKKTSQQQHTVPVCAIDCDNSADGCVAACSADSPAQADLHAESHNTATTPGEVEDEVCDDHSSVDGSLKALDKLCTRLEHSVDQQIISNNNEVASVECSNNVARQQVATICSSNDQGIQQDSLDGALSADANITVSDDAASGGAIQQALASGGARLMARESDGQVQQMPADDNTNHAQHSAPTDNVQCTQCERLRSQLKLLSSELQLARCRVSQLHQTTQQQQRLLHCCRVEADWLLSRRIDHESGGTGGPHLTAWLSVASEHVRQHATTSSSHSCRCCTGAGETALCDAPSTVGADLCQLCQCSQCRRADDAATNLPHCDMQCRCESMRRLETLCGCVSSLLGAASCDVTLPPSVDAAVGLSSVAGAAPHCTTFSHESRCVVTVSNAAVVPSTADCRCRVQGVAGRCACVSTLTAWQEACGSLEALAASCTRASAAATSTLAMLVRRMAAADLADSASGVNVAACLSRLSECVLAVQQCVCRSLPDVSDEGWRCQCEAACCRNEPATSAGRHGDGASMQ